MISSLISYTSPFWDTVGALFWQEAAEEALLRQQEMEERRQRHLEVLVQELPCNGSQVNEVLSLDPRCRMLLGDAYWMVCYSYRMFEVCSSVLLDFMR